MSKTNQTAEGQNRAMQRYYVLQSRIYDATRWSFLFGRRKVVHAMPFGRQAKAHILEVGCGTGYNLKYMARHFPKASFTGMDVSPHMLAKAKKQTAAFGNRVNCQARPYTPGESAFTGQLDAVLFSYSLTMINPQWRNLILQAKADLKPGGFIAVADFHDSPVSLFKKHMANNHVRMDGHLLPVLRSEFTPLHDEIRPAYGGLWRYFVFVGKNA